MGEKTKSEDDYATVRIPSQLANEIDEIIRFGTLRYRTRGEMVKDAIRLRIELLQIQHVTEERSRIIP